ncbi:MAG TPA: glycine cleavage system protein H [Terriglobales bacterium]|nr:glycine cleavage system protein H [Terriglobales bacterium]
MTVLLVLATVVVFLLIDHFYSRRAEVREAPAERKPAPLEAPAAQVAEPRLPPALVNGFQVPQNLRYHPGHTWALSESPSLVRVGLDDFAARLVGQVTSITLPQRGQWIRQGQKVWSLRRDGTTVDMLSPIEGAVTDINEAVLQQPDLARTDPYGEGWLLKVESPDAKTNFRNLLGGQLARWWTEEAAMRLQRRMPGVLDAVAQDGGVAIDSITSHLPDQEWAEVARDFFLT